MDSIIVDDQVVTVGDWFVVAIRTFGPTLGFVGQVVEVDDDGTGQVIEFDVEGNAASFRQRLNASEIDSMLMVEGVLDSPYDYEQFNR